MELDSVGLRDPAADHHHQGQHSCEGVRAKNSFGDLSREETSAPLRDQRLSKR